MVEVEPAELVLLLELPMLLELPVLLVLDVFLDALLALDVLLVLFLERIEPINSSSSSALILVVPIRDAAFAEAVACRFNPAFDVALLLSCVSKSTLRPAESAPVVFDERLDADSDAVDF